MLVRVIVVLVALLARGEPLFAQAQSAENSGLLESIEDWVREGFDETLRSALEEIDEKQGISLLDSLLQQMQSSEVLDLARFKTGASTLVPLLEQYEETLPYAVWLKTRLDYLDTAEELRRALRPAPPRRGMPEPVPVPMIQLQRRVWVRQMDQRPLPPRAQGLVPVLKPIFMAEKVPPQFVWLAEVESSFDPGAKSPSGAAGLFQLMKPTARSLGLSTWLPDERLNSEKSARAAARYLRYLHGRFGDWRLALAAYNAGEARVGDLLKKSRSRTYEAIAHRLPSETQLYVPKVEAVLRKREGVALSDLKVPVTGKSDGRTGL